MKKASFFRSFFIFFLLIFILFSPACKKREAKKEEVIKIGAILPLTGQLSYLGEEEKNTILFLAEEINKKENVRIEVKIEDSKSTSKDGLSAYYKLRMQGINYFLCSLTIVVESIKPIAEKDGSLIIALSVHPDIAKDNNSVIRIYYGLEQEMQLMVNFLKKIKAEKVAALYIDTPEDRIAIDKYFQNYLQKEGIKFLGSETYSFADKSIKPQLIKLKAINPDYIMTIDFGYFYPILFREANELGIRRKILGGLGMMTAPKMPYELTEGIYFASADFVISPTNKFLDFKNKYKQKYGKEITFDGVYTYDALNIFYNIIKNGGRTKLDFLNKNFEGISGSIFIDIDGTGKVKISIGKFNEKNEIIRIE